MRISYSGIETYIQCPQKFKFRQIDKIKTKKSKVLVFGTIIHSALKFLHSKEMVIPPLEKVLEHYKNIWNKEVFTDSQEEEIYFSQGESILKNYYAKNDLGSVKILGLETPFEVPIGNHILAGKIDRIDIIGENEFEIIDYKTSKTLPAQEKVDDNLQLSLYRVGISNRWPNLKLNRVKLSLYFLKHNIKLSTSRTNEELETTKNEVLKVVSEIEKGKFFPTPSGLCDYCEYKNICPMWKHQLPDQEESIKDQEELKNILKEFFEIRDRIQSDSEKLEKLKLLIGKYCDKNNLERVFGENGYITRSLQKRYGYDFDKIRFILEPLGIWDQVLKVDNVKLKKVADSLPRLAKKQIQAARFVERESKSLLANKKSIP